MILSMHTVPKSSLQPGIRLDKQLYKYLLAAPISKSLPNLHLLSRTVFTSGFHKLVYVDGKSVKPAYKYKDGQQVGIDINSVVELIDHLQDENTHIDTIEPVEQQFSIVYEDGKCMIVDKPHGMVMHPAKGHTVDTLANGIKYYALSEGFYDPNIKRAGIVHRLDRDVGGLVVIAKSRQVQESLRELFEQRKVLKIYHGLHIREFGSNKKCANFTSSIDALEWGLLSSGSIKSFHMKLREEDGDWNSALNKLPFVSADGYIARSAHNRKKMQFDYREERLSGKIRVSELSYYAERDTCQSLILLGTGRTHQIRATFEFLSNPLLGDATYGASQLSEVDNFIGLRASALQFVLGGKRYSAVL